MEIANKTFLKNSAWDILARENCNSNFLKSRFFGIEGQPKSCLNSSIWPALKRTYGELLAEIRWLLGKNSKLNFWSSNWFGEPLISLLKIPKTIGRQLSGTFSDYWNDGWTLPSEVINRVHTLQGEITSYILGSPDSDYLVWTLSTNTEATSKAIFQDYMVGNIGWNQI